MNNTIALCGYHWGRQLLYCSRWGGNFLTLETSPGSSRLDVNLVWMPGNISIKCLLLESMELTSIIRRYTEGFFSPNYKLTIGVDFALKVIFWDEKTKINLQLWDVAGHERFGHMTRVYYKYAIAAIIVFDLTRPATFEAVLKWHWDVNQKVMLTNEKPIPVLLLANKCDLEDYPYDEDKLNQFCQEHGFIGWFPTSAKEDKNIGELSHFIDYV
ncbi:hypothetical protein ACROYT_G040548 [Oculina patagonica]